MVNILFVCLGNICRSPMAEAIFRELINKKGLENQLSVDSAGITGWHVGKSPDRRTVEVLLENGIETSHLGRKLGVDDFETYQHIAVMDEKNFEDFYNLYYESTKQTPPPRKLFLIRDFDPEVRGVHEVPDPYYDDKKAFREVYKQLYRSSEALIDYLIEEHDLNVSEGKIN